MTSSEGMTSSTCSFAYSYQLVKKCFLKICETSKCHNFLIFQPIFIRFSLFCSENFTLSSEIKLEQLWTSPLSSLNRLFRYHTLLLFGVSLLILTVFNVMLLKNLMAWRGKRLTLKSLKILFRDGNKAACPEL